MYRHLISALATLALAAPLAAGATTYEIDPAHSDAQFTVRHMMVSNVRGEFSKVTGTVELDEKNPAKSHVDATIDATTVDTREAARDKHLKSPDFFDVEKFPTITFKSTKVEKAGKDKYKVTGDLTLHGVTKPVVLSVEGPTAEAKDPWGNLRRGISATTKIDRKDFGLTWNKALETGGVVVGDTININIDAEMIKKAPGAESAAKAENKAETKPAAATPAPAKTEPAKK